MYRDLINWSYGSYISLHNYMNQYENLIHLQINTALYHLDIDLITFKSSLSIFRTLKHLEYNVSFHENPEEGPHVFKGLSKFEKLETIKIQDTTVRLNNQQGTMHDFENVCYSFFKELTKIQTLSLCELTHITNWFEYDPYTYHQLCASTIHLECSWCAMFNDFKSPIKIKWNMLLGKVKDIIHEDQFLLNHKESWVDSFFNIRQCLK